MGYFGGGNLHIFERRSEKENGIVIRRERNASHEWRRKKVSERNEKKNEIALSAIRNSLIEHTLFDSVYLLV